MVVDMFLPFALCLAADTQMFKSLRPDIGTLAVSHAVTFPNTRNKKKYTFPPMEIESDGSHY